MAEFWVAPIPRCPVHGPMKPRSGVIDGYTGTVYACPGWDGEGCDYEAPPADFTHIGHADSVSFTMSLDSPNARIALGGEPGNMP